MLFNKELLNKLEELKNRKVVLVQSILNTNNFKIIN